MPHLTLEYSANLETDIAVPDLCAALRDAMVETGVFPLGGIRVRAFPCRHYVIADGDPSYAYLHMICRIGHGRDEDIRLEAAKHIYGGAEAFLKPRLDRPFALSLDLDELHPTTSLKHVNTIHEALKNRG